MTLGKALMIGEVDDFLIAEMPEAKWATTAKTFYLLEAMYQARQPTATKAIKLEAEPTSYTAYEIARAPDRSALGGLANCVVLALPCVALSALTRKCLRCVRCVNALRFYVNAGMR